MVYWQACLSCPFGGRINQLLLLVMRYRKRLCYLVDLGVFNRKLPCKIIEVPLIQFLLALMSSLFVPTNLLAEPFVLDQGRLVSLLSVQHRTDETILIALGELAFKDKSLLEGSNSFGLHMSCEACHPDGALSQIEGSALWGVSHALRERATISNGGIDQTNFDTYEVLRMRDVPEIDGLLRDQHAAEVSLVES